MNKLDKKVAALRVGLTPLGSSFAWRIREITKLYSKAIEPDLARHGLTFGEWRCLRALWEEDGLSQRELSERLTMTTAAATSAVDLLERDGLADRTGDRNDKRRFFVRLTRKGKLLRDQLLPKCRALNIRLFAEFSDAEVLRIDADLNRLLAALEREIEASAAPLVQRKSPRIPLLQS